MKTGTGKFFDRKTTSGDKDYHSYFFYVPVKVAEDSAFPFMHGEEVKFIIDNGKIVIEKKEKQ